MARCALLCIIVLGVVIASSYLCFSHMRDTPKESLGVIKGPERVAN